VPPAPLNRDNLEEYELVDFAERGKNIDCGATQREARRTARKNEKRRRLEEQFDMKFSHSLQFNAVPDWSSHYIAYSNLKKL
jgi:hypothetical protein